MNLPSNLFSIISNKLNLKTFLFNKEKSYLKNIKGQTNLLKKSNLKTSTSKFSNNNNLIITYILTVTFLKNTTNLIISDVKGNIKLFISAGFVKLKGKQKKQRRLAISKLIKVVTKEAPFILTNPVALHLNNVNFYKNFIISKLKKYLYLRVLKNFNQIPYNGCKKQKLRRKKYTKRFK